MEADKSRIAELVVKIQNGDNSAFDELYKATNQRAFFVALEFVKNNSDAEDILQESYIKALSKIRELDKPESFQSWLNQIVANKSKDCLKKKKPSLFEAEENEVFELIPDEDTDFTPEDNLDKAELQKAVMEVLDELGEEKKACVMMMYFEELSVGEIAQALEIPEGTVKTRLFSARKDLKGKFEKRGITSAYSVAPIGVVLWAMRRTAESVQKSFLAGPAPAKILAGISASGAAAGATAAVTGGAAVVTAGTGAAVAGAGGSIAAKIAALTVAQKVIAGVSVAAVVAGSAAGVATVANNARKNEVSSTTAVIEESTTAPSTENITVQAAAGTVEFTVSENSETLSVQNASTTVQASGEASAVSGTAASSAKPASTAKQQTTKPSTAKTTTQSATKPTTTKPSASNTTTTGASVAKTTKPTTKPSTKPAQTVPETEPPETETTTKKVTTTQAPATVNVTYIKADGKEITDSFTVPANTNMTYEYLESRLEYPVRDYGMDGSAIDKTAVSGKSYDLTVDI